MKMYNILAGILLFGSVLYAQQPSLYSDIKAHQVGDIITVIIVESSAAQRGSGKNNSMDASANVRGSVSGDVFGNTASLGISSSRGTNYDQEESSDQQEQLSGRIAVQIMERTDSGLFRIEGERKIEVNGESNTIKLSGFVRPRDIAATNQVFSYHIAGAQISYQRPGVKKKVSGFFGSLIRPLVWGVAIAAALGSLSLAATAEN